MKIRLEFTKRQIADQRIALVHAMGNEHRGNKIPEAGLPHSESALEGHKAKGKRSCAGF
jgi:hypothetical protein